MHESRPFDLAVVDLQRGTLRAAKLEEVGVVALSLEIDHHFPGEAELALPDGDADLLGQLASRSICRAFGSLHGAARDGLAGAVGVADQQQLIAAPDGDVRAVHVRVAQPPPDAQEPVGAAKCDAPE